LYCQKLTTMKTIQLLKLLITIIFWGMILVLGLSIVFLILLLIFDNLFPPFLQNLNMLFRGTFPWQVWIAPVASVLGYILFIMAIYYLKKCITPIQERRFYSEEVILNLKKSGRLFIIIAIGVSLIRIVGVFIFNNFANNIIAGTSFGGWNVVGAILSAVGGINFFLLIIGLFLLVFSSVFEDGKLIKQENDLTI